MLDIAVQIPKVHLRWELIVQSLMWPPVVVIAKKCSKCFVPPALFLIGPVKPLDLPNGRRSTLARHDVLNSQLRERLRELALPAFLPLLVSAVELGPLICQHLFRKFIFLPAPLEQPQGELGRCIRFYSAPWNESRVVVQEGEHPPVVISELEICLPEAV